MYIDSHLNKKIKIAIVGCGRISKKHLESISFFSDEIDLVAICDTEKDRLREAKEFLEISNKNKNGFNKDDILEYLDFSDFINAVKTKVIKIDLVILTTPSGLHCQQTLEASSVGINVCTEKPMATKLEDGIAMVEACKKSSVKLFVVKQNRFNKSIFP